MPHQKPDIRKQSYLGSSALHFTGKTGGVHIWVERSEAQHKQRASPLGFGAECLNPTYMPPFKGEGWITA